MLRTLCAVVLLASFAAPALAAPSVGEQAPDLGPLTWAMSEPEVYEPSELRGEAIFIEVWGMA